MCVTEKVTKAVHFTFVIKKNELFADILFLKTNIHSLIQLIWSIIPSTGHSATTERHSSSLFFYRSL